MKTSWNAILLPSAILTAGFTVVVFTIGVVGFEDTRTVVIFGTLVMGLAVAAATVASSRRARNHADDDHFPTDR